MVPLPFAPELPAEPTLQPALAAAAAAAAAASPLRPLAVLTLPWQCAAVALPPDVTAAQLAEASRELLGLCHEWRARSSADAAAQGEPLSYNLLLSTRWMWVVPRSAECQGPLAINALGFAGTLLVRDEESAAHVRQTGPVDVLAQVGCAWPSHVLVADHHA